MSINTITNHIKGITRCNEFFSLDDYPRLPTQPTQYRIEEWDGTTNIITAIKSVKGKDVDILVKYEDGVVNEISISYFFRTLKATKYYPLIIDIEFVYNSHDVTVMALLSDNSIVDLFNYYDDEISFSKYELISLTVKQAEELKHKKDVAYLKS